MNEMVDQSDLDFNNLKDPICMARMSESKNKGTRFLQAVQEDHREALKQSHSQKDHAHYFNMNHILGKRVWHACQAKLIEEEAELNMVGLLDCESLRSKNEFAVPDAMWQYFFLRLIFFPSCTPACALAKRFLQSFFFLALGFLFPSVVDRRLSCLSLGFLPVKGPVGQLLSEYAHI